VVFSALAMKSVGKAAMDMVMEVRRQFREIPGIMDGTGTPEYGKCVEISTKAALREMMLPGALTIITPLLIGLGTGFISGDMKLGAEVLGGYMAGVAVSGVLWAIFQNNAGGAWDNAKKSFEAGVMINGEMTFKGSDAHKAAVTGDTVGDPFKDTSGPSMNILIKLTCLVGLVIAPILGSGHGDEKGNSSCHGQQKCEMNSNNCDPASCNPSTCAQKENCDMSKCNGEKAMKCDMSKCATMTKEECAKMCDEKGCSAEEKAICMAHYGKDGKWIGGTGNECTKKKECCKGHVLGH
jgi:K(+)-stimulated pyrophosphate-energized sodium pump